MSLPDALDPARTSPLRSVPPPAPDDEPVRTGQSVPRPDRASAARATAVGLVRRTARTRVGGAVLRTSRQVARRVLTEDAARAVAVDTALERVSDRIDELARQQVDEVTLLGRIEVNRVNSELLKAEVRGLERTLQELGMALAPATGLDGVAARFGELREQVNAVSRRLRQLDVGGSSTPASVAPAPSGDEESAAAPRPGSKLDRYFDYVAFERRFRGAPEDVLAIQEERYADVLAQHGPVVDLGCGRGELAEVLARRGVAVIGVEPDGGMVSEARDRGLTVHRTDAATFLRSAEPSSLGAVFSAHVAEHIPFDDLLEIVHLSLDRLVPGGIFVAETPNPASLIVPSNSFILDPTHLRPVHPSLFAFVCETAGFRDVRLQFYSPASGYHLDVPQDDGTATTRAVVQHADKLNEVLFGYQEYTVVATKAA